MTSDIVHNGKNVKHFVSVPNWAAIVTAIVLVASVIFNAGAALGGFDTDYQEIKIRLEKKEVQLEKKEEQIDMLDLEMNDISRDLQELRMNLRSLMHHQGLEYIDR